MKKCLLILSILFLSCTNQRNDKTQTIPSNDTNESNTAKPLIIGESEHISALLILDGRPFVGYQGKAYRRDEAGLITALVCDFNLNAAVRWYSLEGIEQLVNLKSLSVYGENLDTVDLTPLSLLSNLERLNIHGNITRLPDLTKLEKLSSINTKNSKLESLEGVGAPNIRWIEIFNQGGSGINSLTPLNNLPYLESLDITSSGSTTIRIADMSNLPKLKSLQLDINDEIDLQGIDKLSALEKLSVVDTKPFNIEGIGKLENLWQLFRAYQKFCVNDKSSIAIPRNFDCRALIFKQDCLFRVPVPAVPAVVPGAGILLIAQVLRHLRFKRPLENSSG